VRDTNKRLRGFLAALLLGLAATALAPAMAAESILRDFDGNPRQLEDYVGQGKWTVVMFWAYDCHICNLEAPRYEKLYQRRGERDLTVLGISIDGEEQKKEAQAFIREHKLSFPNLIGEPEATTLMFTDLTGARWIGTPTFLIYTPTGKLVAQQAGGVPVSMIEDFIAQQTAAGNL